MKRVRLLIGLSLLLSCSLMAQNYRSYPLSETQTSQNGVFYSVAQTELVFKVKVEKNVRTKGIYSESAYLLGIDNASVKGGESYRIKSVCVTPKGVANPEHQYFLSYSDGFSVDISETGILRSITKTSLDKKEKPIVPSFPDDKRFPMPVKDDLKAEKTEVNPIFEKQLLNQGILNKHPFLTAQQAVAEIKRLREQQIKIISGEVEGTYLNTTVDYMYKQLDEIINGYVALFTGVETVTEEEYTFSIIPQKPIFIEEDLLVPVFKFSKERGVSSLSAKNDDMKVVARIHSLNTTKNISSLVTEQANSKDFKKATEKQGVGIYYSVPEQVEVFVEYANETLANKKLDLAQYGFVTTLINGNKQVEFDQCSGLLKKIW